MRVSKRVINGLSRREFLIMTSMAATSLAVGCATNPVTGQSQNLAGGHAGPRQAQ